MKTNFSTERKEKIMKKFLTPFWTKASKTIFNTLCLLKLSVVFTQISAQCVFLNCPNQAIVVEAAAGECTASVTVNTPITNNGCSVTLNNYLEDFPIGTTIVTFTTDDGDVCEVSVIVQEFGGAVGSVSCNDYVQVSLNDNCEVEVTPDMVTEGGPYGCMDLFTVSIGGVQGNVITSPGTYNVTITTPAGNSCWGVLEVEDKLGPLLECKDVHTYCSQLIEPGSTVCEFLADEDDTDGDLSFNISTVNPEATLKSVEVQLDIETNSPSDLAVTLVSAEGTSIDLFSGAGINAGPNGCQVPDISVTIADDAHFENADLADHCGLGVSGILGSFKPVQAFSTLNGENPNGSWSLQITNNGNFDFEAYGKLIIGSAVDTICFPLDVTGGYVVTGENQYSVDGYGDCGPIDLIYQDKVTPGECSSDLWETIERTWTATDPSGNVSQCVQYITVERPDLDMMQYPKDWDGFEYPALECWGDFPVDENGHPDPSYTGTPAFPSGYACPNIQFSYEDLKIDICPSSYKIIRTWNLLDWCTGEVESENQIIKVEDDEAPYFECPFEDGYEFYITGSYDCTTDVVVPEPELLYPEYECNDFVWEVEYKYYAGHPEDCFEPSDDKYTDSGVITDQNDRVIIEDLPKGCTWIKYTVTDLCGNSWEEVCVIHILDGTSPTAVCIENTVASVGPTGCVKIFAQSFDNGSHDNCELESIDVRRMGDVNFDDHVEFCCEDVGNSPHMVEFRVTDKAGLTNICMIEVEVQDKLPPIITCPEDVTVDCRDLHLGPDYLGHASYVDNCVTAEFTYEDDADIDQCGVGHIQRTFTLESNGEVLGSCSQWITVYNNDPFTENDIDWPNDLDATECNGSLHPDDLEYPYDYPVINDDACSLTAATYEEQVFEFVPGACAKIIRTWTVIDWCQYEEGFPQEDPNNNDIQDGIWTSTQILKLNNEIAPEFSFCSEETLNFAGYGECEQQIEMFKTASDDCTLEEDLVFHWEIDLNDDGIEDATYNGVPLSGYGSTLNLVLPFGCHSVKWSVEDICGNVTTCKEDFCIEDKKKPTPYCFTSITTVVMNNNGQVEVWANDFDLGSEDNCGDVLISFSPDVDSTYAVFDCDDIPNGEEATLTLQMWVTDEAGNQDYCEITLVLQDNAGDACDPSDGGRVAVSGLIRTEDNRMVEEVEVNIVGSINEFGENMMTSETGAYAFEDVLMSYDYTVTAEKDFDYLNGVSTLDLVFVQKHVLGIQPFDSPYKVIAADVDGSESVSAVDLINMRKLILGIIEEWPSNTPSWSFVNSDQVFSNDSHPWPVQYEITLDNINNHMYNQDMIAVKIGDVTNNAVTTNLDGEVITESRSEHLASLVYETNSGAINVTLEGLTEVIGLQTALDLNGLSVSEISSDVIDFDESNYVVRNGKLIISWSEANSVNVDTNTPLFTIYTTDSNITNLTIDRTSISSELYDEDAEVYDLEIRSAVKAGLDFTVYQNTPNPFSDYTQIKFYNPEANQITLTVTNVHGKQVLQNAGYFEAGNQSMILTADELPTGILYYTLEAPAYKATKKMIVIK